MATLRRQALGEAASLGSLYDARTDSFIPLSLLNGPPPAKSSSVTDMPKTDRRFIRSETKREKPSNMNISAELNASFLSGLVKADGSGSYLNNAHNSKKVLEASLVYNITTKSEALRLNDEEVKKALAFKSLKMTTATHVVIGIEWGANSIVTFRSTITEKNNKTDIEGHFKLAFDKLKFIKVSGGSDATVDGSEGEDLSTLEFTVFGDVLAEEDATPLDIDSAVRYMRNVPQCIKKANNGKGKPIVYTLLPIEMLSLFWMDEIQIEIDSHYRSIGAEYLEKFVQLFDQIHDIECALNDYHSFIMSHSTYGPIEHLKTVRNNRDKVRQRQASLKTEYAKLLQEIRGGKDKFEELTSLYKTFHQGDDAPENLTNVLSQGRDTFINAFFNYIKYEDMEEALEADKLAWLIPCAFSTQRVDPDDPDGRLVETRIRIGSSDSELDSSSGQSATQETAFYPFQLGDVTVRLIDTPGIGDTRGVEQDQKNMANVLNVLSQFEKIHGIIILLKPNTSRLNVIFRFCVEELLTHLHRDATQNMVFGFTNARSSNYQPGDTFVPLQSMLKRYGESENIGTSEKLSLGLYQHNTYYFDSESFRYLAAYTQGIDLGNRQEYINSWNFSAAESRRLLRYFRGLKPHHVKNTPSLNNTRKTITSLTKPMAEIIQVINATIALNEETTKGLRDKEVSVEELKLKLNIQQVQLHSETLDMPRTVCSNMSCVEYRDGRNGTKVAFYEQSCPDPCYLDNVDADTIAHAQLINCSAFSGKPTCSKCQHAWQEHLHVMYHLNEVAVTVPDPEIQKLITQDCDTIKTKQDAIRRKEEAIEKYRLEHSKIQQAAVDFSFFLKANSITPYNDAMIEYLDLLIKQEKDKISAGGTIDRLERLERSRQEYRQLIETVQMSLKKNDEQRIISRDEVEIRVKELFDLKYYGEQLRKAVSVIDKAHSGTYREKPNKTLHVSNKKGKKQRWWNNWNIEGLYEGTLKRGYNAGRDVLSKSTKLAYVI
ncbi:hypothetical protein ABKA04_000094 [Annulohypoxylon sp. FPYF3050]